MPEAKELTVRDHIEVRGYVTMEKFLIGQPLAAFERLLGFKAGRLVHGAAIAKLDRLPRVDEFELRGYSMVADHRHVTPGGLDLAKIKQIAVSSWSLVGRDRLVKVMPRTPHDRSISDDDQYPPGAGVPQWKLVRLVPATITAEIASLTETYLPAI